MDKRYLIVIPYFAKGAQGNELTLAVNGWRKHFKEEYRIVVVGDYNPIVDTGDDIEFIECPRVPEPSANNYRAHIDFVNKFKKVREKYPNEDGFIFVADDVYAVNDFTFEDVACIKKEASPNNVKGFMNKWQLERNKTRAALKKRGYKTDNYVTHLPIWFEWEKVERLWDEFDMAKSSHILEDLYFNVYHADDKAVVLGQNDRYKFRTNTGKTTEKEFLNAMKKKIWLQNGVFGWSSKLKHVLEAHYGL